MGGAERSAARAGLHIARRVLDLVLDPARMPDQRVDSRRLDHLGHLWPSADGRDGGCGCVDAPCPGDGRGLGHSPRWPRVRATDDARCGPPSCGRRSLSDSVHKRGVMSTVGMKPRVAGAVGAITLASLLTAGAEANSPATGLFVVSPSKASPGAALFISTARAGEFLSQDAVRLFLVPKALVTDVRSSTDVRVTSIGTLRVNKRGRGSLRVRVPDLTPGVYLIGRSCPRCRRRSYRPFTVLRPTRGIPTFLRSRMSVRIEDVRKCNRAYSEALLSRFFLAFNSGDVQIDNFLAPEDRWIWWRDPANVAEPVPRSDLQTYLRTLHTNGVRFHLQSLTFTGYRTSPRLGEFGLRLDRGDKSPGDGKAAVDCGTGLLSLVTIDSW